MRQTFSLPDAIFQKREAGVADLRIDDYNTQGVMHYFNRVWITRSRPSGQPPEMPLLPDVVLQAGNSTNVALRALDAGGVPLPLSLASAPGFASLQGSPGAQTLRLAPSLADVRSCADVVAPGVTSSPSYVVSAVANDPKSALPSGAITFRVTVSSPPAPPALSVSTRSLTFNAGLGQDPPAQSLTISFTGPAGSALNWTASASTTTAGSWLSVSPASGTNDGSVQIAARAASLAAGSYSSLVTIRSPGAQNSPITVAVTLNVAQLPTILAIYDPGITPRESLLALG